MFQSSRLLVRQLRSRVKHSTLNNQRAMIPRLAPVVVCMRDKRFQSSLSHDDTDANAHHINDGSSRNIHSKKAWQAQADVDIQRVTQQAMIRELVMEQTSTLESVVPWFLETMPLSYFRRVPEKVRMDHIKAIAAIKEANMDFYLNLKSVTSDGRHVLTLIRPGIASAKYNEKDMLLEMVKELPYALESNEFIPLTRAQVFASDDGSMALNMFIFGKESSAYDEVKGGEPYDVAKAGDRILKYAQVIQSIASASSRGPSGHTSGEMAPGLGVKSLSSLQGGSPGDWSMNQPRSSPLFERESLIKYMHQCPRSYLERSDPRRFLRQRELFDLVSGTEGTAVVVEDEPATDEDELDKYWINVAVANTIPQIALENTTRLCALNDLNVIGAWLDMVSDGDNGSVTILRVQLSPMNIEYNNNNNNNMVDSFRRLTMELKRCKWLDPDTMNLVFDKYPWLGVKRGEIITAYCALMHPIMAKENALVFSKANILETVTNKRHIGYAATIADLFINRFHPMRGRYTNDEFETECDDLRKAILHDVEDTTTSELLLKMIDLVANTLKTNIFMNDRYALGLRLDPKAMHYHDEEKGDSSSSKQKEDPFGILFVHGRRFNGYHVRFRDISRGGMRLVTPRSSEEYALESARQYDECYGLAFAQQLKNKDIPEGGSKAVNLINVVGMSETAKNFVMRKSVKAFTDTILDLIVDTEETREKIVDYYGKQEILYLGPDEQVIPEDINWVVQRAAQRGYGIPAAFMSSKPHAGINHKDYGVTSEGVNVYLDVALRNALNINPQKDAFTIKMTGGPDGDVGGNEIQILIREYGANAKIVGIADHSGCAEDPAGLNHTELLRLVGSGLCISHFDTTKLGPLGVVHHADTEDGLHQRNSMHNRLQADAFIPCGGRPNTIDIHNYKNFLLEDGQTSSSPLIVEGANLFVTEEARQALFDEAGVIIVKDSSANKGGVITSSYEICAAMMVSEDEFYNNKEQIVSEVVTKLKELAQLEANLLFQEFESHPGLSLPHVSKIISDAINVTTDALQKALNELSDIDRDALLPLFRTHLPETLASMSFDHIHDRVPEQYIKNAIASCLASKIVYKEGTKFIESQSPERLANVALQYIAKEEEITELKQSIAAIPTGDDNDHGLSEDQKQKIITLLDAGGARTALRLFK